MQELICVAFHPAHLYVIQILKGSAYLASIILFIKGCLLSGIVLKSLSRVSGDSQDTFNSIGSTCTASYQT